MRACLELPGFNAKGSTLLFSRTTRNQAKRAVPTVWQLPGANKCKTQLKGATTDGAQGHKSCA